MQEAEASPAWAETLVLVYEESPDGASGARFELARACMLPLLAGHLPGRVRSAAEVGGVGGERSAYRRAMLEAPFCYVIRHGGRAALRYSMRVDGSAVCRYVPGGDPGLARAMSAPCAAVAGSDEICASRPGAKIEVGITAPVASYVRGGAERPDMELHGVANVPCGRLRLSGVVSADDYERRERLDCGAPLGRLVNGGVMCFRDYVASLRSECVAACCRASLVVVVGPGRRDGASLTRYAGPRVHAGERSKAWEGRGEPGGGTGWRQQDALAADGGDEPEFKRSRPCCHDRPPGAAPRNSGNSRVLAAMLPVSEPGGWECELCGRAEAPGGWAWHDGPSGWALLLRGRARPPGAGWCRCSCGDVLPYASLAWTAVLERAGALGR